MEQEVKIIEYNSEYQKQVIELILRIQQKEFQIEISLNNQKDLIGIEDFYQQYNGNFWVAIFNERVVGTIALLDIGNPGVALRKMFVAKEHRGSRGVAQQLLKCAISFAKHRKVREIYLGTTPQFLAAHRFYEKNNFQLIEKAELPDTFPIMTVDKRLYRLII
ncbi:GNAT family N-acetyltransferase [Bacillus sp. 2205SS5-2]|uniref:GNAT family N-acetyltransferase n=1 Tax=Bacillus sp. 2205SS5-2 TaxID=3109031 RepID=UPI00300673A5